jgi:hypothetical protein
MKNLITIFIMLLVGCAGECTGIEGTYEGKVSEVTIKLVFLENGVLEAYANDEKQKAGAKWKVVGMELHLGSEKGGFSVFRIENNGDLTFIAAIRDGKREETPKEEQGTFQKIK